MALLFADGFEDGTTGWTLSGAAVGTGRNGNGLVWSATTNTADRSFPATAGPIIAGFAFKPGADVATQIAAFTRTAGSHHVGIKRGTSGEIIAYTGSSTTLGTTATGVLPAGAWSYIELRITVSGTIGTVIINVNNVEVLNLSNKDTMDNVVTTTASLLFGNVGGGTVGNSYDDVYIADTTGTYNNTFLGDLIVEHLRPASDDTAQWVGSDGNSTNNYDLVNEAGTYDGADYVGSATVGQRDLYIPAASSRPVSSPVLAVMPVAVAMKTDAGTRTAKLAVKEGAGGTVRLGTDTGLATSFGEIRHVFDRKGDGTQFTVADVNALRFGIEVAT